VLYNSITDFNVRCFLREKRNMRNEHENKNELNEHEEKFIQSFLLKEKQERYRFLLSSPKPNRRREALSRLNHCSDLVPKYVTWLPSNTDVVNLLKQAGSLKHVYLLSCSRSLDGKTMPLPEAIEAVSRMPENGWGTIVSCIAGQLAYYYDEQGVRRAILKREPGT
jgi:hypothetical protein